MSCVNKPVIYKDCRLLDLPKTAICLLAFPSMLNKRTPVEVVGVFNGARPFPKWSSLDEARAFGYTNGFSNTMVCGCFFLLGGG